MVNEVIYSLHLIKNIHMRNSIIVSANIILTQKIYLSNTINVKFCVCRNPILHIYKNCPLNWHFLKPLHILIIPKSTIQFLVPTISFSSRKMPGWFVQLSKATSLRNKSK